MKVQFQQKSNRWVYQWTQSPSTREIARMSVKTTAFDSEDRRRNRHHHRSELEEATPGLAGNSGPTECAVVAAGLSSGGLVGPRKRIGLRQCNGWKRRIEICSADLNRQKVGYNYQYGRAQLGKLRCLLFQVGVEESSWSALLVRHSFTELCDYLQLFTNLSSIVNSQVTLSELLFAIIKEKFEFISHNRNSKDAWSNQVRDMLESEEDNENVESHVKEVHYIQAEVYDEVYDGKFRMKKRICRSGHGHFRSMKEKKISSNSTMESCKTTDVYCCSNSCHGK
ncbi:hypothetical protein CASFOL_012252 [Castilleja foliolosa]|uniref:Uncharacterized protein n=1 Tax=Castilleja foliolosa TaxID=1961234 RepID=A0ABD3DTX6_9LAMI